MRHAPLPFALGPSRAAASLLAIGLLVGCTPLPQANDGRGRDGRGNDVNADSEDNGEIDGDLDLPDLEDPELNGPNVDAPMLKDLGFGLASASSEDGEPEAPEVTSSLTATFSGPVISALGESVVEELGAATITHDALTLELAAAGVIDAIDESDLTYGVLFDPSAPSTYILVAVHAVDLVAGAELPLDATSAVALVINEQTGECWLSIEGTFTVGDDLALVDGGLLSGTIDAGLASVEVTDWPQDLFPFEPEPVDATEIPVAGGGAFELTVSANPESPTLSPAEVTIDLGDGNVFVSAEGGAVAFDDRELVLLFIDAGYTQQLVVSLPIDEVADGTSFVIGPVSQTYAWLGLADGNAVSFEEGEVTIDQGGVEAGAVVSGSLSITGSGWVMNPGDDPCEQDPAACEDPWTDGQCEALDDLPTTFSPDVGGILSGEAAGDLPPGYDRVLVVQEGELAGFAVLIAEGADPEVGLSLDVATVDGYESPVAFLYLFDCDQPLPAEGGFLTVAAGDAGVGDSLHITGTYVLHGDEHSVDWIVADEG